MSNNILLSIVVPVYNVEKYLDECMESIINNYKDGVEVIVINDGSSDNSGEMCNKYGEKYSFVKVIHQQNGGLSVARNTGIKNACGKYIWFIDSDDYISNNSIASVLEAIKLDKDIILGTYCEVNPMGEKTIIDKPEINCKEEVLPYKYFEELGNVSYAAVRFITKRNLLIENDLMFTSGIYHEDEDWTPRVLCSSKSLYVLDDVIYNYRVGNTSSIMGMLNPKKIKDKLKISRKIYEISNLQGTAKEIKDFLATRVEHMYIAALNEYCLYDKETRKELANDFNKNRNLLKVNDSKKSKFVLYALNILGVYNTSRLLRFRNNIK